jgi:CRP/FNR family transcriptional regulator
LTLPSPSAQAPQPPLVLDALPLFAGLAKSTLAKLSAAATVRHFSAGATLFRAGESPTGLLIILEGQVRVVRTRDGRQSVVHTEGPGGTLAEVPLFDGGTLPATAVAVVESRCLHLRREALLALMRDDPDVALLFLRRLASRVRHVVERLDRLSTQSLLGRLAALLLTRAEAASGRSFALGMTQAEAAEELGTVREVVVRGLAALRREGVIDTAGRGRLIVRDLEALRTRAGE